MREIKFRVWDGEVLHRDIDLDFIRGLGGEYSLTKKGLLIAASWKRLEWLQYTGLKDQNGMGNEMCQGDLVRAYGHGVGKVEKNHWGEWVLVFEDSVETIHDLVMEQDIGYIVGNIYENPELLEVVK